MSLTQERINEIALKTYRYYVSDWYEEKDEPAILEAFNVFLSRIREEQEAVAIISLEQGAICFDTQVIHDGSWEPVFTIPPATLPSDNSTECDCNALNEEIKRLSLREGKSTIYLCYDNGENPFHKEELKVVDFGVSDNAYVVEKKTSTEGCDCKELVEALENLLDGLDSTTWSSWQTTARFWPQLEAARQVIAKHKASMGEK